MHPHQLCVLTTSETTDLWRKISFFVCIPGIAVCALWTYKAEMAHKAHVAHEKEHGEERKVYDYMNMRTKVSCVFTSSSGG